MKKKTIINVFKLFFPVCLTLGVLGCKDFVIVDPPITSLTGNTVFMGEATATAALLNIYRDMSYSDEKPFGGERSLLWMSGLMADEFNSYFNDNRGEFAENIINPENTIVQQNWKALYEAIYAANMIIEQIGHSDRLSQSFRAGIEGEARFIRALMYFYLVNFWEHVPLVLTTDYEQNRLLPQSTKEEVYVQIVEDLHQSQVLLSDQYPTNGRIRPNKSTATALLAKVYIHTQEWEKAINESTVLIESEVYYLENDLNKVFLTTSKEVIWHLQSVMPELHTRDGFRFILTSNPTRVTLSEILLNKFEHNDLRKINWIGKYTNQGVDHHFPYKYKVRLTSEKPSAPAEYLVMFRLAEQYLIRAEARARVGDIQGAQSDLNIVRYRAGLTSIDIDNTQMLLQAIIKERQLELFTEGCNRWFDLKRNGQATTEVLPIPQLEMQRNPSLQQNKGY